MRSTRSSAEARGAPAQPLRLKTYKAWTMAEALAFAKRDLGEDAVILHTRTFERGGFFGFGRRVVVEITAARAEDLPAAPARRGGEAKVVEVKAGDAKTSLGRNSEGRSAGVQEANAHGLGVQVPSTSPSTSSSTSPSSARGTTVSSSRAANAAGSLTEPPASSPRTGTSARWSPRSTITSSGRRPASRTPR